VTREADLDAAIRRFGAAWAVGDVAALEALVSPTYTHVDIYGHRMDRAEWLDYARSRAGKNTRITFRDVRTRHLGDVAVITAVNDLAGVGDLQSRGRDDCAIHFTQVWRWQDGHWQREAFHATIAADG
jgi:ketosteroid isomerase-like protein